MSFYDHDPSKANMSILGDHLNPFISLTDSCINPTGQYFYFNREGVVLKKLQVLSFRGDAKKGSRSL